MATKRSKKVRIDELLVERELTPTRQKAQALIMAGCVLVEDEPSEKPGTLVDPAVSIRIRGRDHAFVSRGGVKLAHAIESFGCSIDGRICMDVGASTGGFTDCLLQNGAQRVYAIDVGYGQLAWKIAQDERVIVIERTNIRTMDPDKIPDGVELAVIDLSFISLTLVMRTIDVFLEAGAEIIALVKPQFEVSRDRVGKGGIVTDPDAHTEAIERVRAEATAIGWNCCGMADSPITGAKGNHEFLLHFKKT